MPRAKNLGLTRAVECAAGQSFLSVGYNATSYQAIADAAGTTRANVQYVAGKKENLLMRFMERVLNVVADFAAEWRGPFSSDYEGMFAVAQLSFALSFHSEGFSKIAMDTLRDRDLTSEMLMLDYRWAFAYQRLDEEQAQGDSRHQDRIIMAMGGFYELLYFHLSRGTTFDYRESLREVVAVVAQTRDATEAELAAARALPLIDVDELAKTSAEIEQLVLQSLAN